MFCFRAESLLRNYKLQQQKDLIFLEDIGRGIQQRPLDLLNLDTAGL